MAENAKNSSSFAVDGDTDAGTDLQVMTTVFSPSHDGLSDMTLACVVMS